MEGFGTAVGERFDKYMVASINAINIFFSGELCYSVHGEPMLLLLGTPKAEQYMFDSGLIGTDGRITRRLSIVGPAIPHSQRWWDDFIKSNCGDDEKAQICAIIWRFYLPLLQQLGIGKEESITTVRTRIAFNWGEDMTEEEIKAKQESRKEMYQRKSDAWTLYKNNKANADQIKFVESTGFGKMMLGWRKYKEDPLSVPLDLQLYLVKSGSWKSHKAKILCMGEEGAELAAHIASIEASANAEMERRKAEKERIEAEMEKKRLDNINKELESIKKIPVEKRTPMHTIRYNLLQATLSKDRREQVRWREKHTKEKKRLAAVKAATKREEIDSKIKSLSTINRTKEEEFQFNLLNAQLRGDKKKVKRLKEQEINDWYEQSYKPKQQQQLQQQQLIQQQQQQLVYQQNLLQYEEQQLNLSIEQQHRNIHKEEQHLNMKEEQRSRLLHSQQQLHYQKERLLQIQQQKQQNMAIFMQLQSQQQQYLTQTTLASSQAKKPKPKQKKPFNYSKVMAVLPDQLNQTTAREFVEKADEMFEEGATTDEKAKRWAHFKTKLNPQQLNLIEEARTLLIRKRRTHR